MISAPNKRDPETSLAPPPCETQREGAIYEARVGSAQAPDMPASDLGLPASRPVEINVVHATQSMVARHSAPNGVISLSLS